MPTTIEVEQVKAEVTPETPDIEEYRITEDGQTREYQDDDLELVNS